MCHPSVLFSFLFSHSPFRWCLRVSMSPFRGILSSVWIHPSQESFCCGPGSYDATACGPWLLSPALHEALAAQSQQHTFSLSLVGLCLHGISGQGSLSHSQAGCSMPRVFLSSVTTFRSSVRPHVCCKCVPMTGAGYQSDLGVLTLDAIRRGKQPLLAKLCNVERSL